MSSGHELTVRDLAWPPLAALVALETMFITLADVDRGRGEDHPRLRQVGPRRTGQVSTERGRLGTMAETERTTVISFANGSELKVKASPDEMAAMRQLEAMGTRVELRIVEGDRPTAFTSVDKP